MLTPDRLRELAADDDAACLNHGSPAERLKLDTAAGLRLAASLLEKLEKVPRYSHGLSFVYFVNDVKDAIAAAQEEARG